MVFFQTDGNVSSIPCDIINISGPGTCQCCQFSPLIQVLGNMGVHLLELEQFQFQ